MKLRSAKVTTFVIGDSTVGKCLLVGVHALGSATASTITFLDGTAIKFALSVATTTPVNMVFASPYGMANLIVDATGSASWGVAYIPVP